ncbi:MAG: hypothetical protein U1E26_03470 [Coriobacteriia bacterium]|nr:hypothetical protein [Coriobacteriia bacterium]
MADIPKPQLDERDGAAGSTSTVQRTGDRRSGFVRWLEGVNSGERFGGHG